MLEYPFELNLYHTDYRIEMIWLSHVPHETGLSRRNLMAVDTVEKIIYLANLSDVEVVGQLGLENMLGLESYVNLQLEIFFKGLSKIPEVKLYWDALPKLSMSNIIFHSDERVKEIYDQRFNEAMKLLNIAQRLKIFFTEYYRRNMPISGGSSEGDILL